MVAFAPQELADTVGAGLLSFPVTHFTDDLDFDEARYRDHLGWLSQYPVAGLFAAGGTGEFFSLTPPEVTAVLTAAVDEVGGRVPSSPPRGSARARPSTRPARPSVRERRGSCCFRTT